MNFHTRIRACALIIENESVLLVELKDEDGIHYNLPAGGTEPGESVIEAVKREAWEEANVDVEVGPLAFVHEIAPHLEPEEAHPFHSISLMFDCRIKPGSVPGLPPNPDTNQIGIRWVKLKELKKIKLYPNISDHIMAYAQGQSGTLELLQNHKLAKYEW